MKKKLDHQSEVTVNGFMKLLQKCVDARSSDQILLFFDESFQPFYESFSRATSELNINPTEIFLSKENQIRWMGNDPLTAQLQNPGLPPIISHATSVADVIINALDNDIRTGPMRRAILFGPRPSDARFAHNPGIDLGILKLINDSPIDQIYSNSEKVAWALGQADQVEISTFDSKQNEYKLNLDLEGWDNGPFMSPGVIVAGSWGNVTPGESFCCPEPAWVSGQVCINGSLPGIAISPGDEIILNFRNGHLIDWIGHNSSASHQFFESLQESAEKHDDQHWNVIAELGIGLNPTIKQLSGNPIFDEKAADTIHIAIGDNKSFGHQNASRIHIDCVTTNATLRMGDLELIRRGALMLGNIDQKRKGFQTRNRPLPESATVFLRQERVYRDGSKFHLRIERGGRVSLIDMAHGDLNKALNRLVAELETWRDVAINELRESSNSFLGFDTRELLNILYHYRMVAISHFD